MSGIGKIFVVLNLVFSLVIVGAAAAYLSKADDWKKKHDDLNRQYVQEKDALEQSLSDSEAKRKNLGEEVDTKQNKIEDLQLSLSQKNDDLSSEKVDNQQLRDDVTKINTTLETLKGTINDLTTRNNELTDNNTQLRTDALDAKENERKAVENLVRVQGELATSNEQIQSLEMRVTELDKDVENVSNQLEVAKQQGFDITSIAAMPEIPAYIEEVNNELGFVILSVGSDDKVKKGYTFHVYRGDNYLGEVQVTDVYPDRSAARIKFRVEGAQFQVNDKASTIL